MVTGGERIRNQDRRQRECGDLGKRRRSRARHHQVRRAVRQLHLIAETHHGCLKSIRLVRLAHERLVVQATQMHELRVLAPFVQPRQRRGHSFVDRVRALTAAHHQNCQPLAPQPEPLVCAGDLARAQSRTDWGARHGDGFASKKLGAFRHADGDVIGELAGPAVGLSRNRIRLVNQGSPSVPVPPRRQHGGRGGKASHPKHDVGPKFIAHASAVAHSLRQPAAEMDRLTPAAVAHCANGLNRDRGRVAAIRQYSQGDAVDRFF